MDTKINATVSFSKIDIEEILKEYVRTRVGGNADTVSFNLRTRFVGDQRDGYYEAVLEGADVSLVMPRLYDLRGDPN